MDGQAAIKEIVLFRHRQLVFLFVLIAAMGFAILKTEKINVIVPRIVNKVASRYIYRCATSRSARTLHSEHSMDYIFATGLVGSLILVTGAAWPEIKDVKHPTKSLKNWLFAVGGFIMLLYAIFNFQQDGPIFFVILQILVAITSILMMLNTPDKVDTAIITISGLGLIIWSLYLFEGYNTIFFIIGLSGIGLGYAFQMGTLRRSIAFTLGSMLIALFSYIEANWIFFWLNVFFAIFSAYYVYKGSKFNQA